ncbi:LacI family DNA-binding transcriptional regulator [Aneurinibacillus tyrosinisolvens]|uniref:LacI family DNA-binding transcriptional regulator n=1 Tax=Aneurinibacillus tyrosinisolvens TaxID=1443435 RepID=UPI00063FA9AA|nr:LacI family DNA-binding transcriptional regulator [Aneurinibacillus tyrosinisolvens]
MKLTIHDIAKEAGVSATTVSKVINNKGRISEKTKNKIMQIIEEFQYQPNVLASALKGKSTYTIALLIPDAANPIYAQYLKHIEEYGQELGFSVVMCSTGGDPKKEAKHITLLRQKHVDGFIIASIFKNEPVLKQLIEEEFPIVLISLQRPELPVGSVTGDDYLGGYIATEHLLSLGHRKIGIIAEEATISGTERIKGYKKALENAGIKVDENLVITINEPTIEGAEVKAKELLNSGQRPTAIFGCNDILAIGTMLAAKGLGIGIPDELSIIGFDNTVMCKIVEPQLSSVAIPIHEMGKQAMELLAQRIQKKDNMKQRISLLPELVIRQSTAELNEK